MKQFLTRYPNVDADRLLREAGIDPTMMGNPEVMHSLRSILQFLESAAHETGDECFGLEYAAQVPPRDLHVLAFVILHSPTLIAGLENTRRFFAVQQTAGRLTLKRDAYELHASYAVNVPPGVPVKQHIDTVLIMLVKFCREGTGRQDWAPRAVTFTCPPPCDPARIERIFGAPVRFRQRENALIIPIADVDLPFKAADPGLLPILQRHATDLIAKIPRAGDLADDVRRQLAELVPAGQVEIESVAARMGIASRSLQRRLNELGVSFQDLLSETRLALARQYLGEQKLNLTEIAFLLGYSDLSAFSRAFRRWTGQSPIDFRKQGDSA